jgi:ubiquinone/menaquinone biosynthesis C-methylase UbiE
MKGHRWFAMFYDALNRPAERQLLGPLRARLLGDLRGRVVEIGAGTGLSFPYYSRQAMVVAVEPDPFMLRRAIKRARAINPAIHLVQGDVEALPFQDGAFDAAAASLVF